MVLINSNKVDTQILFILNTMTHHAPKSLILQFFLLFQRKISTFAVQIISHERNYKVSEGLDIACVDSCRHGELSDL